MRESISNERCPAVERKKVDYEKEKKTLIFEEINYEYLDFPNLMVTLRPQGES